MQRAGGWEYLYNMLSYTWKTSGRTHEKLLALSPPIVNKSSVGKDGRQPGQTSV